ncbi:hypothetical protein D9M69_499630 [compost metagenome]
MPLPTAAMAKAAQRIRPGDIPRDRAASGLAEATRMARPKPVRRSRAWLARAAQATAATARDRGESPSSQVSPQPGKAREIPFTPWVTPSKATSISGNTVAALSVTKPR